MWSQDPEVTAAFADISKNPQNISKYQNNPKVANLIAKMQDKFSGGKDGADAGPKSDEAGGSAEGGSGAGAGASSSGDSSQSSSGPSGPKMTDELD